MYVGPNMVANIMASFLHFTYLLRFVKKSSVDAVIIYVKQRLTMNIIIITEYQLPKNRSNINYEKIFQLVELFTQRQIMKKIKNQHLSKIFLAFHLFFLCGLDSNYGSSIADPCYRYLKISYYFTLLLDYNMPLKALVDIRLLFFFYIDFSYTELYRSDFCIFIILIQFTYHVIYKRKIHHNIYYI